jgi:hypothetical protein
MTVWLVTCDCAMLHTVSVITCVPWFPNITFAAPVLTHLVAEAGEQLLCFVVGAHFHRVGCAFIAIGGAGDFP